MKRVDGIRAVTYDCWGTLLQDRDWEGAMHKRIGALSRFLSVSKDEATLRDLPASRGGGPRRRIRCSPREVSRYL